MAAVAVMALISAAACAAPAPAAVPLRLQVSVTAEELADFRPQVEEIDAAHPEFTVSLEQVPFGSEVEKVTTQLAANELPDVLRLQGLNVQQWIRRGAFADISERSREDSVDLEDFYPGPLDQFRHADVLWGLPDVATPEIVFYNKQMFEAAGVPVPDDSWTYDDMRAAALRLTLDGAGRNATDPDFDPATISQWGWNAGISYFWQNEMVSARGGNWCANDDCSLMSFTDEASNAAMDWWVSLVRDDHAALYDPYGGSQTGVPGDPFLAGKAAMGSNGSFAIGQLNAAGNIDYDIAPPLIGTDGKRHTPLSTNGFVMSAASAHPNEAWTLIKELTSAGFLEETWAKPGHGVPARRSVASSVVNLSHPPANQQAIVTAMETGVVFAPSTAHAFDAYNATIDLFTGLNTGEVELATGLEQIETTANEVLAPDRPQ